MNEEKTSFSQRETESHGVGTWYDHDAKGSHKEE